MRTIHIIHQKYEILNALTLFKNVENLYGRKHVDMCEKLQAKN